MKVIIFATALYDLYNEILSINIVYTFTIVLLTLLHDDLYNIKLSKFLAQVSITIYFSKSVKSCSRL